MLDPETGLFIAIITGIGGVITYTAYTVASKLGPKLEAGDLLPAPPPSPPLPRFMFTKPEVLEELRKR
ncbi:unnamed protein product [marine sediment metagenome]|uniref:Uncharacterized protein n=1 Tax=marine sediment metagenome TaxID=412755 RepID=X1QD80_9ZZZZ